MRICLISLGCDKNLCDSEAMLGLLSEAGYELTGNMEEAEVIIVNSCAFIKDAQEESINTIIEAGTYKKEGNCKYLIVSGCLSQRFREEIREELPEVDAIIGTASFDRIVSALKDISKNDACDTVEFFDDINSTVRGNYPRLLSTGGHYAYIKIAEGCNKRCTYCIIPDMRGSYRSVPMEDIISEAKRLVSGGVRELILVAQETTVYGKDLYGKKSLATLLRRLAQIEELKWIRLLYCYPEEIDDELIEAIATEDKVVNYLDMPIQSGSDAILKKMGRLTDTASIEALIAKLRTRIPGIALRTTLITGFPSETEDDHRKTVDFVKRMRFDRLGVFTYSKEEGTKAATMSGQIDEDIKQKRYEELMELQQSISYEISQSLVGTTMEAFIEGRTEDGVYAARTYRDAPSVDGYIFLDSDYDIMSGEIVPATVTEASEYDLVGEILSESCE